MREYAKDIKLLASEQAKENKTQKSAEAEAMMALTSLFKDLNLDGQSFGKKIKQKYKRDRNEPYRLSCTEIDFPRAINRRVNYGENIRKVLVTPINEHPDSVLSRVLVYITSKDGSYHEIIEERDLYVDKATQLFIGSECVNIDKRLQPGAYSIRAKIIALEEKPFIEKSYTYSRINFQFFVEQDPPPSKGPIRYQHVDRDNKYEFIDWQPDDPSGYVLFYNTSHPKIKGLMDETEKLANFLIEQGALVLLQIKLEDEVASGNKANYFGESKIESSDVLRNLYSKYSEFLWERWK